MGKHWLQSKTMWGGLLTAALSATGIGLNVDLETGQFSGNVYEMLPQVGTLLSAGLVIYGRAKAVLPITRKSNR